MNSFIKRNRLTDIESKLMFTNGGRRREGKSGIWDEQAPTAGYKTDEQGPTTQHKEPYSIH